MENGVRHRTLPSSMRPHIAIVGAGVAGLRCADVLLQRGFKVTILEGRDRIGGRMHQIQLPNTNYLVDTGPNWIHGTDHNPILDLAKETDTPTHSWGDNINIIDEEGKPLPAEDAKHLNDIMWGIVIDAFTHSNKHTSSIPPDQSLYDWFLMRLDLAIPDSEADYEEKRKLVLQTSEMWGAFVGGAIQRQSLKFFWLEECIEGENIFCAGTYQKILAVIAKPALEKADIIFSTKVVKIDSSERIRGKVALTTENGEKFHFDEVVVTAPLGWLKQNQDAFVPPLPPRLSQAIGSIGYGCLEKAYISFPHAFWLSKDGLNSSGQPSSALTSTGFTQFLSPRYSPLNLEHWNQEVAELSTLPSPHAHPTLLFYIFGSHSHSLSHSLCNLPAASHHTYLTAFFAPYFSRLPNYDPCSPSCMPISSHATNWLADPLAGNGSYCNFQIGLEQGDADVEIMRDGAGMSARGVWFAGEHTAPFVALGTVTGAWWSGEGAAGRIAAAYGRGDGADEQAQEMVAPNSAEGLDKKTLIDVGKDVTARTFVEVVVEKDV